MKKVKRKMVNEAGKSYVYFANLKAAFDNINRKELIRMMGEIGLRKKMQRTVSEIYKETKSRVVIGESIVGEFWTCKDVRQGCPLSSKLFNIEFTDLERKMKLCQEAGLVLGREKVWSIIYADDGALVTGSKEGLQKIVNRFGKYVKKKG